MFRSIISEIIVFIQTQSFREGLYVELAGLLFDLILVAAAVRMYHKYKTLHEEQHSGFLTTFFSIQFCRSVIDTLLSLGYKGPIEQAMQSAREAGASLEQVSTPYYGNTTALRDLLLFRIHTGEHIESIEHLTRDQLDDASRQMDKFVSQIDQMIVICASFKQSRRCYMLYSIRLTFYAMRDMLASHTTSPTLPFNPEIVASIVTLSLAISAMFEADRKLLDERLQRMVSRDKLKVIAELPVILVHRYVLRWWCILFKRPYKDLGQSSVFSRVWNSVMAGQDTELEVLASALNRKVSDIKAWTLNHRLLSLQDQLEILRMLGATITAEAWNTIVVRAVMEDLDARGTNLATFDAVKAQAVFTLGTLLRADGVDVSRHIDLVVRLTLAQPRVF
jgi:hypothetical protein